MSFWKCIYKVAYSPESKYQIESKTNHYDLNIMIRISSASLHLKLPSAVCVMELVNCWDKIRMPGSEGTGHTDSEQEKKPLIPTGAFSSHAVIRFV